MSRQNYYKCSKCNHVGPEVDVYNNTIDDTEVYLCDACAVNSTLSGDLHGHRCSICSNDFGDFEDALACELGHDETDSDVEEEK